LPPTFLIATSSDDAKTWSAPRRLSDPAVNATYPRVVPAGGRFLVLWTEFAEDGKPTQRARAGLFP